MRKIPSVLLLATVLLAGTSCGEDDTFPKDDFVKIVSEKGLKPSVAECAYDKIKSDSKAMADITAADGPNDKISSATDEKLQTILVECLADAQKTADSNKS